jgi:hypothetical protein
MTLQASHLTGSSTVRRAIVIAFASIAAAALLLRWASVAEPLGIDQSLWASAVRGMSRGQLLYRDVWEQRPPGIYWIYLAGFRMFGWHAGTVAVLDVLAATATAALLVAIARSVNHTPGGLLAAALYGALTMPAWLYRNSGFLERSVCETFIGVAVAASFWCAALWRRRGGLTLPAAAGLFAGMAIVLKPNAGLYMVGVLVWMLAFASPNERAGGWRRALVVVAMTMIGTAIVPAFAVAWLWRLGLLADAKVAVIDFNRFYVSQGFVVPQYSLALSQALWLRIRSEALWLGGSVGAIVACVELARTRRLSPLAGIAVAWGGAAALAIVANGARLYNTYFIQALPPLAVMTAWLLAEASRQTRVLRGLAAATAVVMVLVLAQRHYVAKVFESASADYASLRNHAPRTMYLERFGGYGNQRGYSARANDELARYIAAHTAPDDRIYLFGINGAGVYFLSDRLTAHRFLRVNFFVPTEFPDPHFTLTAVVNDLSARRPCYIIFERLHSTSEMGQAVDHLTSDPIVVGLLAKYRQETQIEDFTVYRRID